MADLSAKEVGEALDLDHLEVIRRIRRGQIAARKMGGWFWAISPGEVENVKRKDWYLRLMRLRARRARQAS